MRVVVERAAWNHLDLRPPRQIPCWLQCTHRAKKPPHELRRIDNEEACDGFLKTILFGHAREVAEKAPVVYPRQAEHEVVGLLVNLQINDLRRTLELERITLEG